MDEINSVEEQAASLDAEIIERMLPILRVDPSEHARKSLRLMVAFGDGYWGLVYGEMERLAADFRARLEEAHAERDAALAEAARLQEALESIRAQ